MHEQAVLLLLLSGYPRHPISSATCPLPPPLGKLLQRIADRQGMAAATRVAPRKAAEVVALLPDATYNEVARMLVSWLGGRVS